MVLEERFDGDDAFRCEVCGFHYEEQATAERCEDFCREHGSCSSTITEQALERRG